MKAKHTNFPAPEAAVATSAEKFESPRELALRHLCAQFAEGVSNHHHRRPTVAVTVATGAQCQPAHGAAAAAPTPAKAATRRGRQGWPFFTVAG